MHDCMIIAFKKISEATVQSVGTCHFCWVAAAQTVTSPALVPLLVRFGWHQKTIQGDEPREVK